MKLEILTADELLARPFTARSMIAEQLELAARLIRAGSRDDSACWRIADAGLQFRRMLERSGETDIIGLDTPTGMGAMLPGEAR